MQSDRLRVAGRCLMVAALVGLVVGLWILPPGRPERSPLDTVIAPGETKRVELPSGATTLYWQAIQKTPEIDLHRLAVSAVGDSGDGRTVVFDLYERFTVSTYVGDNLVWREIGVARVREHGVYDVSVALDQRDPGEGALVIPASAQRGGDWWSGWYVRAGSTALLFAAAAFELASMMRRRRGHGRAKAAVDPLA